MEKCLTRRHFAWLIVLLLFTSCQTSPLVKSKNVGKIKDDDEQAAEETVPKIAESETAPMADQASAPSDHGHLGRVQIKVYRGPDDHHHHASYGYWVKQPADDAPHHH